ncbi:MAG TPA: hypothetical protein PK344_15060 [Syntrophorhabdaceae bacterium]|nr:hypothetical protein [Syntrophorhabdaceae bacterium]
MGLREDILQAAAKKGIDPYTQPFQPSDLGLDSSKYGSFSDHCSSQETLSGQWSNEVILRPVEFNRGGRPHKYVLIR